jgi:hypothetical protein
MNFSEMTQTSADGAKQAALLVHTMAPADQEWLWSQLPLAQQAELKTLIAELDALGVAKDRQSLTLELAEPEAPSKPRVHAQNEWQGDEAIEKASSLSDVEFLSALTSDEVHELARIWSSEPPQFVVLALNAHDWPWRALLLERMPVLHKRRIEDLLLKPVVKGAPLLVGAVLQSTRACLVQVLREAGGLDSLLDRDPHGSGLQEAQRQRHFGLDRVAPDGGRSGPHWTAKFAEGIRAPWRRFLPSRLKGRP